MLEPNPAVGEEHPELVECQSLGIQRRTPIGVHNHTGVQSTYHASAIHLTCCLLLGWIRHFMHTPEIHTSFTFVFLSTFMSLNIVTAFLVMVHAEPHTSSIKIF